MHFFPCLYLLWCCTIKGKLNPWISNHRNHWPTSLKMSIEDITNPKHYYNIKPETLYPPIDLKTEEGFPSALSVTAGGIPVISPCQFLWILCPISLIKASDCVVARVVLRVLEYPLSSQWFRYHGRWWCTYNQRELPAMVCSYSKFPAATLLALKTLTL